MACCQQLMQRWARHGSECWRTVRNQRLWLRSLLSTAFTCWCDTSQLSAAVAFALDFGPISLHLHRCEISCHAVKTEGWPWEGSPAEQSKQHVTTSAFVFQTICCLVSCEVVGWFCVQSGTARSSVLEVSALVFVLNLLAGEEKVELWDFGGGVVIIV